MHDRSDDPLALAISALPLKAGVDIAGQAKMLRSICSVALLNGQKRMRPASPKEREKQLESLYSQARKLSVHINKMSVHTLAEVTPADVRHPFSIADMLDELAERTNAALRTQK